MKPLVLTLDTLDDRRELIHLLDRLSPSARLDWLAWCCAQASDPKRGLFPRVAQRTRDLIDKARWDDSASERLTVECYMDFIYLGLQYDLDPTQPLARLEGMVRQRLPRPDVSVRPLR